MSERFSTLDEFFLQIEKPHRSAHWAGGVDLTGEHQLAGHLGGAPITETAVPTRVAERIQRYPLFQIGAQDRRTSPAMAEYALATTLSYVSSGVVRDDNHYRELLSTLLAEPLTGTARSGEPC